MIVKLKAPEVMQFLEKVALCERMWYMIDLPDMTASSVYMRKISISHTFQYLLYGNISTYSHIHAYTA